MLGPFVTRRTLRGGSSWLVEVAPEPAADALMRKVGDLVPSVGSLNVQMMIANSFHEKQNDLIRSIETKDVSPPLARAYNKIAERTCASEEPQMEDFDLSDPEQAAIWKTTQILLNKVIYADAYLMN